MRRQPWAAMVTLLAAGCSPAISDLEPVSNPSDGGDIAVTAGTERIEISPANTSVGFLGTKPDGTRRFGGFTEFQGSFGLQESLLSDLQVEFEMATLWAQDPKLADHLRTPDFFDVKEYPQSSFVSTEITPGEETGDFIVVGDLTMHGETAEVQFPVTLVEGPALRGEFTIDRTEFGMDFKVDEIHPTVTVTIGAPGEDRDRVPTPAP